MILELNQPLPLETPKGKAMAYLVIDYGTEHHLLFVCFVKETGECWTFQGPDVRLERNETMNAIRKK